MEKKMSPARWNDPSTALQTVCQKKELSQYPSIMTAPNVQYPYIREQMNRLRWKDIS